MYIYVLNNETKYERKLCFLRIKKTTCFYFSWVCAYRDISTKFWSSSGLAQCESNMTGVEWLTVVCISGKSEQEWVSLLPASIYHLPSGLSLYFGCGWLSPLYFQVLDVCEFYHEISMMFVFFKFFQCSKVIMNCWIAVNLYILILFVSNHVFNLMSLNNYCVVIIYRKKCLR